MTARVVDVLVAVIVVAGVFVLVRPGSPAVAVVKALFDATVTSVRLATGANEAGVP